MKLSIDLSHHQSIASRIRFIGSIFVHCVGKCHSLKWRHNFSASVYARPRMPQHIFDEFNDAIRFGKRQFNVQLCEFGLAIRRGCFVTIASRNLKISIDCTGHQHLLELLWTLHQRIELSALARWHHELLSALQSRK